MKTKWILALALALFGCDDDDGEETGQQGGTDAGMDAGAEATSLTVATYNGGLAVGFVEYAEERQAGMIAALAELEFDVLCVQEFWEESQYQPLFDAFADTMPHTYFLEPDQGVSEEAACPPGELDSLQMCMAENCPDVPNDEVVSCGLDFCGDDVNALMGDCLDCVAAQTGMASVEEIVGICGPGGTGGRFAYGGAFGTAILSNAPFAETDGLVLESSLNRRGVLYARIDTELGEVHAFCTHLSAIFSSIPHPDEDEGGSWEAEQLEQIETMRAWIDQKAGDGQVVLLGDFNTGPEIPGEAIAEEAPNYEALAAGYASPYVESDDAQCTFCPSNPLNESDTPDHEGAVLIDHVLLRGFGEPDVATERFLDGTFDIEADGMTVETGYSDHYGVSATLTQ